MSVVSILLFNHSPEMWFNRPAYNSYMPSGYSYPSYDDPYARAIARERAAREREAAARHAELLYRQQMQDTARSPYNSYLSGDGDSSVPDPYDPSAYAYPVHEGSKRRRTSERQQQPELARQVEPSRRREEGRDRESQQCRVSLSFWVERPPSSCTDR